MKHNSIHIIALASLGGGLSGGDRIFIELARRWSQEITVNLYVWEQGLLMCQREKLAGKFLTIHLIKVGGLSKLGFIFTYLYRILLGLKLGLSLNIKEGDCVYSSSEFWMDSLPALILKLRNGKAVKWVAAWFQTAPNPFKGFAEGKREKTYRLHAFFYWFMQLPIKPLIGKFANFVLVNNQNEEKQFTALKKKDKIIVVLGAVNTEAIVKYLKVHKASEDKKYLGVFQGRFHPQKGVVELIEIWRLVTDKIPNAKLAMIGNGPLMNDVKNKIRELKLERNIKLFGYLHDGEKKYSIFNNSKIVVHPAFFDSGGMASAEAMAFGLPCVGFNLKSYRSYYPKGMLKAPIGDLKTFSDRIIQLVDDKKLFRGLGLDARDTILKNNSWNTRAETLLYSLGIKTR